jgi:hypothetical protein
MFDAAVNSVLDRLALYISNRNRRRAQPPLGIHGQLDGIRDGEVYGWAMDCDHPSQPLLVTISVDRRPAAEVAAVRYRADLETTLQCSGSYGFCADLGTRISSARQAVVEARVSNGQMLKNSPQTVWLEPRASQGGPTVLFMHIPKSAGIAFREAIAPNYRECEIGYLYGTSPGFLVGDLRLLPLEQRRDLRFLIGHFQYGIHHDLPRESLYVTVVREPAARMLSQYAFLQRIQPEVVRRNRGAIPLDELLRTKPHLAFDNMLVRHFGGVDERAFPPGAIGRQHFDAALYFLQNGFTFVGHQEFAAEAYASMQQRFGWNARPKLEIANAGLGRRDAAERARVRKALEQYNPWDCQLYEEILKLFPYPRCG